MNFNYTRCSSRSNAPELTRRRTIQDAAGERSEPAATPSAIGFNSSSASALTLCRI